VAVTLFATAIAVAALARRLSVPESVLLVIVGLAGATLFPEIRFAITPTLVLSVFVPGLVFAAAYAIEWPLLRGVLAPVVGLAVPGVVASAAVVAVVLSAVGLPATLAFVVGAITAATDPVAIVATMSRLRVPAGLRTLVEAESLLNDGTGLVLFALAVRAATVGIGVAEGVALFVVTLVVSSVVGIAGAVIAARAIAITRERSIQLAVTLLLAYGSYQLAAAVGLSGILATVIAGIVLGTILRRDRSSAPIVEEVEDLWEVIAFTLTSLVFLLIGFAIDIPSLGRAPLAIALGTAAVIVARAIMVYVPAALIRVWWRARAVPRGWAHVVFWSGLRGAIALAAALSLPADFPSRELIQQVSFGIVLVTLIAQGMTASFVVRRSLPEAA
jgi:CPA1 family monovalent cation:H+ antiporter